MRIEKEAMWVKFESQKQFAVKVYVGGVNAVSGQPATQGPESPQAQKVTQDYIVIPDQKWLDGVAVTPGKVRQFVAVSAASGYDDWNQPPHSPPKKNSAEMREIILGSPSRLK